MGHMSATCGVDSSAPLSLMNSCISRSPSISFPRAAENRATALQASLSTIQANDPDVARLAGAEADARRQLADATKKLEKYQATFGGFSKLPPDTASLAEQLHLKEEALHKLRLQVSQHVQVRSTMALSR